ncbi:MAG: glycerophosphodiester phosphodiesterase [Gaiellales bacterium]
MTGARPQVCAHRGASRRHADNSMAAFAAAIEMGADMIETDVRRTDAGRIVLAHDPLRGDPGDGLPALADLVRLATGRIALDVELKEAGYEADVLAVLDPRPAGLVVTSFLPEAVAEVRALDPGVLTGLIFRADDRRDVLQRTADCGPTAVVAHVNALDAELTRAILESGQPLMVWTVNKRRQLASVMENPAVSHVVTDVPDIALAIRAA